MLCRMCNHTVCGLANLMSKLVKLKGVQRRWNMILCFKVSCDLSINALYYTKSHMLIKPGYSYLFIYF